MRREVKQNLQTLVLWVILMTAAFLYRGRLDFELIVLGGWACLIVAGVSVAIWEKIVDSLGWFQSTQGRARAQAWEEWYLGKQLYIKREFRNALTHLNNAIEYGPVNEAYALRGACYQEAEKHDLAIADFTTAILLDSTDCNLFYQRALSKEDCNDHEGAKADIIEAIRLSKITSTLNEEYADEAVKLGWSDGHTSIYEAELSRIQLRLELANLKSEQEGR